MLNAKKTTFRPQYSSQEDDGTVSCVARTGLGAGSQESFGYTTKAEDADTSTSDHFHPSFSAFNTIEAALGVVNTSAVPLGGGAVHLLDPSVKNLKLFIQETGCIGPVRVWNCENANCCSNWTPGLCPGNCGDDDLECQALCEPCNCIHIFDCQTGGSPVARALLHHGWPLYDTRYFLSENFQPPSWHWEMQGRKLWDPMKGGPLFRGEGQLIQSNPSSSEDTTITCNFCDRLDSCIDLENSGCPGERGAGIVLNYDLGNLCQSDNIFVVFKRAVQELRDITTVEIRASQLNDTTQIGDVLFRDVVYGAQRALQPTAPCFFNCVACRFECVQCDTARVGFVESVHYEPEADQSGSGTPIAVPLYMGHEPDHEDVSFEDFTVKIPDRAIVGATKQVTIRRYGGDIRIPGDSSVLSGTPTQFRGDNTSTAAITIKDADFVDAKDNPISSNTDLDQDFYGNAGQASVSFDGGTGPVFCDGVTAGVAPGGAFLSFVLN